MTKYVRVEGHSKLLKDPHTGVIINSDVHEIENARLRKRNRKQKEIEEQELKNKIDDLTENVNRLESMFRELLEKEYGNRNQ
jgi:hypothetical protein